jgi:hypothetical protein
MKHLTINCVSRSTSSSASFHSIQSSTDLILKAGTPQQLSAPHEPADRLNRTVSDMGIDSR